MPWKPAAQATAPPEDNVSWYRDIFTGENRTEFPEAPEFSSAYSEEMLSPEAQQVLSSTHGIYSPEIRQNLLAQYSEPAVNEAEQFFKGYSGISRSQLTPDPKAQLDILRKNIPGLQVRPDKFGNIMVRAPGMKDFTYLNKPGASKRDLEELGAQSWATFPLLAAGGSVSGSLLNRTAAGAGGLASSSVAEDILATEAGSKQGVDPKKAAISAALGGATAGVAEPIIGGIVQGAKKASAYPLNRIRGAINPEAEASRRVMGAAREDLRAGQIGLDEPAIREARARGQDPRVMDIAGETMRAEARRAANLSPTARQTLQEFLSERFSGQNVRLGDFISRLVRSRSGKGPNAFLTSEQLKNAARTSRAPLYKRAYKEGENGLTSPTLRQLEQSPAIQSAMKKADIEMRNRVVSGRSKGSRGITGNYTLEYWDLTKRRLDDIIKELKRNGRNSEALDLDTLRKQLIAELDRMVPSYAAARGIAARFFGADDALEAGEKFVRGRYDLQQARRALADMTAQERELFAEGFASRYIEDLMKIRDRRNILTAVNQSNDARERLSIALGPNRAREIESFLRIEQFMDLARTAMGNSTTARQLAEMFGLGYGTFTGDPTALMLSLLSIGSRLAGREIDRRVMERVANQLISQDVETFLRGVRQIASSPILDSLRALDNFIAKMGLPRALSVKGVAGQLSSENPETPPTAPQSLPAQRGGGPGTPPITTPSSPQEGGVPGSTNQNYDQTVSKTPDTAEAYRMAAEAIQKGADPLKVRQRLVEYGIDPGGLA